MEEKNEDGVEVGMTGGYGCWTDTHVYMVTKVTKKTFTVVELEAVRNKRQWPDQEWEINMTPNPNAEELIVRKNRKNSFVHESYKFSKPANHTPEELGNIYYLDPSF